MMKLPFEPFELWNRHDKSLETSLAEDLHWCARKMIHLQQRQLLFFLRETKCLIQFLASEACFLIPSGDFGVIGHRFFTSLLSLASFARALLHQAIMVLYPKYSRLILKNGL